jgi:ferredoxin--NADP+ reductase
MTTPTHAPGHETGEIALPEAKMHLYRPGEPCTARITKSEICTAPKAAGFVRHVEFDVSGTQLAGNVLPGQSIGVIAPGHDEKGRPHAVRLYSVASPTRGEDGKGTVYSTTVKRTIDEHWETHKLFLGVASNHLCDLQVGDEVKLSGPNGKRFLLPADKGAHDYIFFATGTGIAPFRGMVIDLLESGLASKVVLVMGSPYATDLLYDINFRKLESEHDNFTYLTAISREKQTDGHDRMYVQDRLVSHREQLLPMLASERTLVYVCGIAGMELGILQQLARLLPASALEQYMHADAEAMSDIAGWNRKMLHKQLKLTRRMVLEVYA